MHFRHDIYDYLPVVSWMIRAYNDVRSKVHLQVKLNICFILDHSYTLILKHIRLSNAGRPALSRTHAMYKKKGPHHE